MNLGSPPLMDMPLGELNQAPVNNSLAAPITHFDNAPRINDTESEYKESDPRQTFSWFKKHMSQILEAYERTIQNASSIDSAEIQVVAFGRLLITKMTEIFPNLKDEILKPAIQANSPKKTEKETAAVVNQSIRDSQTFKPNSSGLRQIDQEQGIERLMNIQAEQMRETFAEQGKAQ